VNHQSPATPHEELVRLVKVGVNASTLEECDALARMIAERLGVYTDIRLDGRGLVLKKILSDIIEENRQRAFERRIDVVRREARNVAEFRVAAAGELLGLTDSRLFAAMADFRAHQLDTNWSTLQGKSDNQKPLEQRQLRASIWTGAGSARTGERRTEEALGALAEAIKTHVTNHQEELTLLAADHLERAEPSIPSGLNSGQPVLLAPATPMAEPVPHGLTLGKQSISKRTALLSIAAITVLSATSALAVQQGVFDSTATGHSASTSSLSTVTPSVTPANLKVLVDTNPFHVSSPDMIEVYARRQEWLLPAGKPVMGDPGFVAENFYKFAKSYHGVAVGRLLLGVTIQNLAGGDVYLRSMEVTNLVCGAPAKGIRIFEGGGADPLEPRAIIIDLDAKRPIPLYYPKTMNLDPAMSTPKPFGFPVPGNDTAQFDIAALLMKSKRSCSFELAINAVVNGESRTVQITDAGKPFKVAGSLNDTFWMYNGGGGPATWSGGTVSKPGVRSPSQPLTATTP
jgi:hypothetical protein